MKERLSSDDDGLGGLPRQGGAWLTPSHKARLTGNPLQCEGRRAPVKEIPIP